MENSTGQQGQSGQLVVVSGQRSAVSGQLAPCQLFVVLITFVRKDKGVCYFGKVNSR